MKNTEHTLVVGGTKGIGLCFVRLAAAAGQVVSVIGRTAPTREFSAGRVRHWAVDLLENERLLRTLAEVRGCHGKLDHLVFFQRYRGEGDGWAGEIATSLTATRTVIEAMSDQFKPTNASIVVVSSVNARLISPNLSPGYHVAKAALVQLVRYFAVTLGRRRIRVNCVSPGTVVKQEARAAYMRDPKLADLYRRMTPLSRMGTARDVAEVVEFLCSAKSSFVTGQDIVVDGGRSLQLQERLVAELHAKRPQPL